MPKSENQCAFTSKCFLLLLLSCTLGDVTAYPNGAGTQACSQQSPKVCHGDSAQSSQSPYAILVRVHTYMPNATISVVLKGLNNTAFVGFLLGAHRVTGNTSEYLGTFAAGPDVQPRCGTNGNSGLTHTDNKPKQNVTVAWTAPSSMEGDLEFKCAFVHDYGTYWVNVTSAILNGSGYPNDTTTISDVTTLPSVTTSSTPMKSKFPKDSSCGQSKSCYGDCSEDGCTLLATWRKIDQWLLISISSVFSTESNVWAAIGFGTTSKMNIASVSECVVYQENIQAFMSVNRNYDNSRVSPNDKLGLSNLTGRLQDGILYCQFRRQFVIPGGEDIFNVTQPYHVLLARGKAAGWDKLPHNEGDAFVTSDSYDLTALEDIGAKFHTYPLVKLHGCLMTVAWILSGSIGVLVARFYKTTWATHRVCGVHLWFAIHRFAMVSALCATVIGFIAIIVDVRGYSHILGKEYQHMHPVLGIVVTSLTVINPIMSLFRCAPDSDRRPIFNWIHWAVGSSAYILGIITIGIGTTLERAQTPQYVTYIVNAFGAWHFTIHFLLQCIAWAERKSGLAGYTDLQSSTSFENKSKYQYQRHKIFIVHVFVTVFICIAVITEIIGY